MQNMWDERYSTDEYVYGEAPNDFFKEIVDSLPVGKILLPADGEGRNSVYAAQKGWMVDAFDQSAQARIKAMQLAQKHGVEIDYRVMDFGDVEEQYPAESFDVIALTYAHLPVSLDFKIECHKKLLPLLKSGGLVILEGFSKEQLEYQQKYPNARGPREESMLYSEDEIYLMFEGLEIIQLSVEEVTLSEGVGHQGKNSVLRFVGRKG